MPTDLISVVDSVSDHRCESTLPLFSDADYYLEPPSREYGWPPAAPPGSILHVVGCECRCCPTDQCKAEPIGSGG